MFKRFVLLATLLLAAGAARASWDPEPEVSTAPIGSSYYRHLAQITNIDLHELEKFERRGFARTEINVLIIISSGSVQTLKDYGNRRLKDNVPLRDLIKETKMDADTVYAQAHELKIRIEAMGDQNLPPAVYEEVATSTSTAKPKKTKKEKQQPLDEPKPVIKPE